MLDPLAHGATLPPAGHGDTHHRDTNGTTPPAGASCLAAALDYAGRGWRVFPVHTAAGGRCSCGKPDCTRAGKHPRTAHGLKDATMDQAVIRDWWDKWPSANVGIATGQASGLWMLGPDGPAGADALAELVGRHGALPPGPRARSGGGGEHRLYAWPADGLPLTNRRNHRGMPIDVRGEGGYFVAPPSVHPSGNAYAWEVPPPAAALPPAPVWLLAWVRDDGKSPPAGGGGRRAGTPAGGARPDPEERAVAYIARCEPAVSGQGGHDKTLEVARAVVYGFDLGQEAGFRLLEQHYNHRCAPPWSERELRHKCQEADTKPFGKPRGWLLHQAGHGANGVVTTAAAPPPRDPPPPGQPRPPRDHPPHLTDRGNGIRLVRDHGGDLRHCHPWRAWLVWDARRWCPDDTAEVTRRAKRTLTGLFAWALSEMEQIPKQMGDGNDNLKARLAHLHKVQAWALTSESARHINAMVDLARSEPGVPVLPGELDRDPWLLNCPNGTLELRTGTLRGHRREDMLTKLCPTPYDPDAPCPVWERTLLQIFGGNGDLVGYWQRLLGYCLTGDVREQILPVLWGKGSNGKSLLINTVLDLLGEDYAMKANRDLFMARKRDSHPTGVARLFAKRFVACIETQEGGRLDEALVKELTGGDKIAARRMREDEWEFTPTHKCFLATNHKPEVRGTDDGIWRRQRLIPFTVRFWDADKGETGPEQLRADKGLPDKLRAEFPGILAWCVRGCRDWLDGGMRDPEAVRVATAGYRGEQDIVARYLAERCTLGGPAHTRAGELYADYRKWHEAGGEPGKPMSNRKFGESLRDRGLTPYSSNGIWYEGVGLNAHDDLFPG